MTPLSVYRGTLATLQCAYCDAVDRWRSMASIVRATTVLLALMIIGGVVLRIQGIGFPPVLTFDEQFYAPTAHHYLVGTPDLHDYHPPLSKLLGSIGLILFGNNSVGWRFMYLCFGLQTIVIAFWLAREIFSSQRAGWLAAAFVATDGFFIVYSRAALPDGMLTCLVLWSLLAVVTARSWRGVAVAAVLIGAATSIKWSGAQTLVPAVAALLLLRHVPWYTLFLFAISPLVHFAIWIVGLHLMGHPSDLKALWDVIVLALTQLAATAHHDNPLASAWYTWPVLYHPIVVKLSFHGTTSHYASSAGNPVYWFPISLLVVGLPLVRGVAALRAGWRTLWSSFFDAPFTKAVLVLAIGWVALFALFAVSMGKHSFFYHYQPSYGFGIVLLAGVVAKFERRWPVAILVFVVLAVAMALYLAPVWGEFALTLQQANRRLLFVPWRP